MTKDLLKEKLDSCSVNINGNATNIQIQQGTINSIQTQTPNEEFDYVKIAKILDEINKYRNTFSDTYGENSAEAECALNDAIEAVSNRDKPSKIKKALSLLKDLSLRVSSSLIATGILELLKQINI